MNRPDCKRTDGFTLLELLIALAIFGLLSVMSYSGLRTVMEQQVRTQESADRLAELQKIFLLMQRDMEQIVPRPIRDEFGDESPALVGSEVLQFTRGGWSNPLARPRSNLQRVGYAFENDRLVRYSWQVLDRAQDSLPLEQPLSEAIVNMSVRYLSPDDEWLTSWPEQKSASQQVGGPQITQKVVLPKVVEITLEHEFYGEIVWLFRLPQ